MTNTLTFTAGKSKNCIQFMLFPAVNVNVFVVIRILNVNVNVNVSHNTYISKMTNV